MALAENEASPRQGVFERPPPAGQGPELAVVGARSLRSPQPGNVVRFDDRGFRGRSLAAP